MNKRFKFRKKPPGSIGIHAHIFNGSASGAFQVEMRLRISVKTFLRTDRIQFQNNSCIRKLIQISVYSPQTDSREAHAHNLEKDFRAGMILEFAKLLQDHSALNCITHFNHWTKTPVIFYLRTSVIHLSRMENMHTCFPTRLLLHIFKRLQVCFTAFLKNFS